MTGPRISDRGVVDLVQPFQLENGVARGRFVRLGPALQDVLTPHQYPECVAYLLSEMLALTALVAGLFKFDGVLSLQVKGDGPVGLVVVDLTSDGGLRGFAQFDPAVVTLPLDKWQASPVPLLFGSGYLTFTVDQGIETERYQGIVQLKGETLSDCAHYYFKESDQVTVGLRLAAGKDRSGNWRSGGLLLQKMPPPGLSLQSGDVRDENFEDGWRRTIVFIASSREEELLHETLHPHEFLVRLFCDEGVRVFESSVLEERCRCSYERVEMMLKSFPRAEIEQLRVDGTVLVTCEFCGCDYTFEDKELEQIYKGDSTN